MPEFAIRRSSIRVLLVVASLVVVSSCPAQSGATDALPTGIDRVLAVWRDDPTDPQRRRGVVRWAESRGGVERIARGLLARAVANQVSLDAFFAGQLAEVAGARGTAWSAYELALSLDRESPAQLPLIELAIAAGWLEFARSLTDDLRDLPLPVELALRSADRNPDLALLRKRLSNSGLPVAEQSQLALDAGLPRVAAALAESAGESALAARAWLAAGETLRALHVFDGDTLPPSDLALDFVRLTGDRRWLPPRLTEEDRRQIEHSLEGRGEPLPAEEPRRPAPTTPPNEGARERAALSILGKESDNWSALERDALSANGPPSLAVAAAWLRLQERERARREIARWRLEPRPGEEVWETALRREVPEWFGSSIEPSRVLARAEEIERSVVDSTIGLDLDRALLASAPGSKLEAALLFQRSRLISRGPARTEDLARAIRLAPQLTVRFPHRAGVATVPLTTDALRDRWVTSPLAEKTHLDQPVGRWGESVWLPPSRAPRVFAESSHISEWSLTSTATEQPVTPRSVAEIAPIVASLELAEGVLWFGRGIAETDRDGVLRFAIRSRDEIDWSAPPAQFEEVLAPAVWRALQNRKTDLNALLQTPGVSDAWERVRKWGNLPPDALPESIIGSNDEPSEGDAYIVIRGGGVRLVLARGAEPPTAEPEGFRPHVGGGWIKGPAERLVPPQPTELPEGNWRSVERRSIAPSERGREELPARPLPPFSGRPTPGGHRTERIFPLSDWHLELSSDGWCAGVIDGQVKWWAFLPPPLPGPGGWHFAPRPTNDQGRRGPDRAGKRGDAGTIALRELPGDRVAILTDRITLVTRSQPYRSSSLSAESWIDGDSLNDPVVLGLSASGEVINSRQTVVRIPGAFDMEVFEDRVAFLAYDPRTVSVELHVWLSGDDRSQTHSLPESIWLEEDRARQIPVALGRWGNTLLLVERGRVWRRTDDAWQLLAKSADGSPPLPANAWQGPPVATEDGLLVAWPWGTQERFAPR